MKITVRAPGKLMIMGEHAVVYGFPCIVTAIDRYLSVSIEDLEKKTDVFLSPDNPDQRFLTQTVAAFKKKYAVQKAIKVTTQSDLGAYGFGSSAATVVATLKALSLFLKIELPDTELFHLGLQIVQSVQGVGSGFDIAASLYGGTIYFNGKTKEVIPLLTDPLPMLVAYSGIKVDTVQLINMVSQKRKNYKKGIDTIFESIEKLVLEAKTFMEEKDWQRVGTLANYNQNYLEDLGVSSEKLNKLIISALKSGAFGAKLSGAGGGDCMIAFVSEDKKQSVINGLQNQGGEIIPVISSVPGVCQI
jgi:mevalonate kinase